MFNKEISSKDETLHGWPDHEVKSECADYNYEHALILMKTIMFITQVLYACTGLL